jgi:hypothetical protein
MDTTTRGPEDAPNDDHPLEAHRAIARELNRQAQRVYSRVGSLALLAALAPPVAAAAAGAPLATPVPWLISLSGALVVLLAGRSFVRRRVDALRARLDAYCATNGLSLEDLRRYYAEEGTYAFLASVLDASPRP